MDANDNGDATDPAGDEAPICLFVHSITATGLYMCAEVSLSFTDTVLCYTPFFPVKDHYALVPFLVRGKEKGRCISFLALFAAVVSVLL